MRRAFLLLRRRADQQHPGAADRRRRHLLPARSRARRCRRRLPALSIGGGDPALVQSLRESYGLDQSALARLWLYLTALARLDLGWSVAFGRPILDVILERLPNTLWLMGSARRAVVQPRLAPRHRRRRAARKRARPRAVDRLARALCGAEFLARPRAERRLFGAVALVSDCGHRNHRVRQARARARARHRPPSGAAGRRRSASSIWRCSCRMMRAGMAEVWRQDFALAARAKGLSRAAHRAAPRRAQRAAAARHHARAAGRRHARRQRRHRERVRHSRVSAGWRRRRSPGATRRC